MARLSSAVLVLTAGLMAVGACHRQTHAPDGQFTVRNVITQDQIDSSNATSVYELIRHLHADYLKDRGKTSLKANQHERAVVFLNDQEYGIPETLRNMPISRIAEIRYYSPTEAAAKYGSQYAGGVILLISRTE